MKPVVTNRHRLCRADGSGRNPAAPALCETFLWDFAFVLSGCFAPVADAAFCHVSAQRLIGGAVLQHYAQHLLYLLGAKVGPAVEVLEQSSCGLCMFQVHSMCSAGRDQIAALQQNAKALFSSWSSACRLMLSASAAAFRTAVASRFQCPERASSVMKPVRAGTLQLHALPACICR